MESNNEQSIRIIRYGEWKWSEIIYLPETKKYIKRDYEEEYLDTGTRYLGETEVSFDEVLSITKKSADALLILQKVSGVNLEKEIKKVNAIIAIRNDIIQKITKKPSDKYEIGSLLWEDAKKCIDDQWDYAGFSLNLRTKELYVNASTYPDRSYNYHESTWSISVTEFHKIATRYFNKFQNLKCEEDWDLLFDSNLQSAVDKALEILEKGKEVERKRNAIVLGNEYFCLTPEMIFQEIVLESWQGYHKYIVKLTQNEKKYHISYEDRSRGYKCEHDLTSAEAVWLEVTVDETMQNKDMSIRPSVDESLCILIKKSGQGDKPYESYGRCLKKYEKLMNKLENLAKYGSIRLDETEREYVNFGKNKKKWNVGIIASVIAATVLAIALITSIFSPSPNIEETKTQELNGEGTGEESILDEEVINNDNKKLLESIQEKYKEIPLTEKIDKIYVTYDHDKEPKIPSIHMLGEENASVFITHKESKANTSAWVGIDTKKEALVYFDFAKKLGATRVMCLVESESGMKGFTCDINDVINGYMNNDWSFDEVEKLFNEQEQK